MRRRSRLAVLERLARLREREALVTFAGEQRATLVAREALDGLTARLERERSASRLALAERVLAAQLADAARRQGALETRRTSASSELAECERALEAARERLAQERLRVRAVQSAAARRAARERAQRRRIETRRLDEASRGLAEWRRRADATL